MNKEINIEQPCITSAHASSSQFRLDTETARTWGVRQYWISHDWDPIKQQREAALKMLSERLGVDEEILKKQSRLDHNIMNNLIIMGHSNIAKEIASDPSLMREKHPELFEIAQKRLELFDRFERSGKIFDETKAKWSQAVADIVGNKA